MSDIIRRPPYIKGRGYLVNPVVVKGIPKEADSRLNPNVIGTVAWEQYWTEQLYYIHNGYQTGGLWVPGRYYYYMNYTVMNDIEIGAFNPDNTDLHLEYAMLIDYCKKNGANLMAPKARRRGLSEASHSMVVDYDYRFSEEKRQLGVAAGHSVPIDDFITKWKYAETQLPPELYIGKTKVNQKEVIAGWQQKNDLNAWESRGTFNTIYLRTMGVDPNMFKGLFLHSVVFEELGEFDGFLECWDATKDCLMSGQKQIGSAFAYGTGGRIDKGSKDFKAAWERDAEKDFCKTHNFIRWVPDGRRMYYFGGATLEQKRLPIESKLREKYKDYQLIGVDDIELAEADILARRKAFLESGDLEAYNKFVQNNPINEREIFRKTSINNFNQSILNAQLDKIRNMSHIPYTKYKAEYVKDENTGLPKQPVEIKLIPLNPNEDQSVCIVILDEGHPAKNFTNRYCAGIDSYNVDLSDNSKSLGGMLVLDRQTKIPVAYIRCRPKTKEIFYELCLKLSIYYKMHLNVLGDIASDGIMGYFDTAGHYNMLAYRPKKFEALTSEQKHPKWVRLTTHSKPLMIGLMQFHVNHHCENIMFPELLDEIGDYDEISKESDNDLADAYGIALMQDVANEVAPRDNEATQIHDRFDLPRFENGKLVKKGDVLKNIQQDSALFGMMFGKQE